MAVTQTPWNTVIIWFHCCDFKVKRQGNTLKSKQAFIKHKVFLSNFFAIHWRKFLVLDFKVTLSNTLHYESDAIAYM